MKKQRRKEVSNNMFKCSDCKLVSSYDELKKEKKCFEEEYGIKNLFESTNYYIEAHCPGCGSDDIHEAIQCPDCEEWFLIEELEHIESEEKSVCKDCLKSYEIGNEDE